MPHAGSKTLDELEPLLRELRQVPGLVERSRGVFYRRSRAFLHFHEDATGIYADVRAHEGFDRLRVTSAAERAELLSLVTSADRLTPPGAMGPQASPET